MPFKLLDPEVARSLLEGHEDIITPAAALDRELIELAHCPVCGSQGSDPVMSPPKFAIGEDGTPKALRVPFTAGKPNVVMHAKCRTCASEFSQHTGVVISQNEPVITSV